MVTQYAININHIHSSEELNEIKPFLSEEKKEKIDRFYFEKDKIRAIIGEALVRCLLVRKYKLKNADISIGYNANGKPFLLPFDCGIHYNISHAGDWIVCGIGDSNVGIDVEQIREKEINFASNVLTKKEYDYWEKLSQEDQRKKFYQMWTIKESFSKYLGIGLSLPFSNVEIKFENCGYFKIGEEEKCIGFSQQLDADYYLTVCVNEEKKEELQKKVSYIVLDDISRWLSM